MTHGDLPLETARSLLTEAQRTLIDLYSVQLIEVLPTREDEAGLAVLQSAADPRQLICLFVSLPIGEWVRHIKYLINNPDSPHEAGVRYGTTRISPRGYGKPIRG